MTRIVTFIPWPGNCNGRVASVGYIIHENDDNCFMYRQDVYGECSCFRSPLRQVGTEGELSGISLHRNHELFIITVSSRARGHEGREEGIGGRAESRFRARLRQVSIRSQQDHNYNKRISDYNHLQKLQVRHTRRYTSPFTPSSGG